ncbi:MAG: MaoC family dehydratase N-terminal domain-containing protein [Microthrixaceae bacterium]
MANLGYAECRFHRPLCPGDTLSTRSEVIGLKQNSNGRTGVVYVRSTATDQHGEVAIEWARWVMVHKRDHDAPAPDTVVPDLSDVVDASDLVVPEDSTSPTTTSVRLVSRTAGATTRSASASTTWTGSP